MGPSGPHNSNWELININSSCVSFYKRFSSSVAVCSSDMNSHNCSGVYFQLVTQTDFFNHLSESILKNIYLLPFYAKTLQACTTYCNSASVSHLLYECSYLSFVKKSTTHTMYTLLQKLINAKSPLWYRDVI